MKKGVTRRELGRTTAAVLLTGLATMTDAQETKPTDTAELTSRVARLEKERGVAFTDAQRKGLPAQLKDIEDTGIALRKYALQDGGSEPAFVFSPLLNTKLPV